MISEDFPKFLKETSGAIFLFSGLFAFAWILFTQ